MSLQKFLTTIDTALFGFNIKKRAETLHNTNPKRFYVENVRQVLNTNTFIAKTICEMAVKDNKLEKKIGIECPNESCGRIISVINADGQFEDEVICDTCELLGREKFVFETSNLRKVTFYKLKNQ